MRSSTTGFSYSLLSPRYWPTWLGVAVLWLLARFPYRISLYVGRFFGAGAKLLLLSRLDRLKVVRRNLELCFPKLDAAQCETLVKANLRDMGLLIMEFTLAWFGSKRTIQQIPFEITGLEHLTAARKAGRGILLVGAHFSHLELAGRLLTQKIPLAGMYREHGNAVLEWVIKRARLSYASVMFKRNEVRGAVKHLKAGGILWYAPDQQIRAKDSVFVPFFGIPAATITATHHLARLSGAMVIPFFHQRKKEGGYLLRLEAPLANFPSKDVIADTARINELIEEMVREAPEQYLWLHKRFKARPRGEKSIYEKN